MYGTDHSGVYGTDRSNEEKWLLLKFSPLFVNYEANTQGRGSLEGDNFATECFGGGKSDEGT